MNKKSIMITLLILNIVIAVAIGGLHGILGWAAATCYYMAGNQDE